MATSGEPAIEAPSGFGNDSLQSRPPQKMSATMKRTPTTKKDDMSIMNIIHGASSMKSQAKKPSGWLAYVGGAQSSYPYSMWDAPGGQRAPSERRSPLDDFFVARGKKS